jgi:hypothetical protein
MEEICGSAYLGEIKGGFPFLFSPLADYRLRRPEQKGSAVCVRAVGIVRIKRLSICVDLNVEVIAEIALQTNFSND